MLDKKAWLSVYTLTYTKDFLLGQAVFMDLALCAVIKLCWNRKGTSQNCSHKDSNFEFSKMPWYAEELRVPITGTKGMTPTPKKQVQTIYLNAIRQSSPDNCKIQPHPLVCQMERHPSSLQRTHLHWFRVQR
ncbi:hypothetical protein ILYODFUR_028926 [Ilyodon furcidens]|uniref:Uncharacterized protein n=1 Tax=Ilyodon furcidens TaxID=33524 RepID=A0ABV0TYY4_9TELE